MNSKEEIEAQETIMAKSCEGFGEWMDKQTDIDDPNAKFRNDLEKNYCQGFGAGYREACPVAWQAATLAAEKRHAERIEKLESALLEMTNLIEAFREKEERESGLTVGYMRAHPIRKHASLISEIKAAREKKG